MIDWKLLATAYTTVFIAELGDKTQLATLSLAVGGGRGARVAVLLGSALALCTTSLLAVAGADVISRFVSPLWLRRTAGAAFLVLGVLYLFRRGDA